MPVLDAKAAADLIKPIVHAEQVDHLIPVFVSDIAHHLKVDTGDAMLMHIARIIGRHDIRPYEPSPYPKMATHPGGQPIELGNGRYLIFQNKAEEDAFNAGQK